MYEFTLSAKQVQSYLGDFSEEFYRTIESITLDELVNWLNDGEAGPGYFHLCPDGAIRFGKKK